MEKSDQFREIVEKDADSTNEESSTVQNVETEEEKEEKKEKKEKTNLNTDSPETDKSERSREENDQESKETGLMRTWPVTKESSKEHLSSDKKHRTESCIERSRTLSEETRDSASRGLIADEEKDPTSKGKRETKEPEIRPIIDIDKKLDSKTQEKVASEKKHPISKTTHGTKESGVRQHIDIDKKPVFPTQENTACEEKHRVSKDSRKTKELEERNQKPDFPTQEKTAGKEDPVSKETGEIEEPGVRPHTDIDRKPVSQTQEKTASVEKDPASKETREIEEPGVRPYMNISRKADSPTQEKKDSIRKHRVSTDRRETEELKDQKPYFSTQEGTASKEVSREILFTYWCQSNDVNTVKLHVKNASDFTYDSFDMKQKYNNFYEIRIFQVGRPILVDKIKYYFEETYWYPQLFGRKKKMNEQVKEKFRNMSNYCKEGVLAHLKDIVLESETVQDVIAEYKLVPSLISSLSTVDINWLLTELFKCIVSKYRTGPENKLLQLAYLQACIACDCNNRIEIIFKDLQIEMIEDFLTLVGQIYIERKQCDDNIELFLSIFFNRLCTHIIRSETLGWTGINACSPFVDSKVIHDILVENSNQETFDKLSLNEEKSAIGILITFCKKVLNNTDEESFINKVFKILPFDVVARFFSSAEFRLFEFPKKIQDLLKECFYQRIKTRLLLIKSRPESCWKMFIDCYESVKNRIDSEKLKRLFEDTCMYLVQNGIDEDNAVRAVDKLLFASNLFKDTSAQVRVLRIISESRNEGVNRLFLKCGRQELFRKAFIDIDGSCFEIWYYSSIKTSKSLEKHDISNVCVRIISILKLELTERRDEMLNLFSTLLRKEFDKFDIEELLNMTAKIANFSEDNSLIGDVFTNAVSSQLRKKPRIQNPEKLTVFKKSADDTFLIESRLQAEVTCMVIDNCYLIHPTAKFHEKIKAIVEHSDFWALVLNARGKHIECVHVYKKYVDVRDCVSSMIKRIRSSEVDFCLLQSFPGNEIITKNLFSLLSKVKKDRYYEMWIRISEVLTKERQNIACISNILAKVNYRISPNRLSQLTDYIEMKTSDFESGHVLASPEELKALWKGIDDLPRICGVLERFISSDAFWSICDQPKNPNPFAEKIHIKGFQTELITQSQIIESNVQNWPHSKTFRKSHEGIDEDVAYLTRLEGTCVENYKQFWQQFCHGSNITLHEVMTVLTSGANLQNERTILSEATGICLDEDVWVTLGKLFNIDLVKRQVEAMKEVFNAFDIVWQNDERFNKAVLLFQDLLQNRIGDRTFEEVKLSCKQIFTLTQHMSEETQEIFISLKKSKPLIGFLKEHVNEDIENLLDAVDDISEQFVSEATVSALINTQKFLQPILKAEKVNDCNAFLTMIESQIGAHKKSSTLAGNISDCVSNLHNLISLYKNVANKEEQTKDIVKSIIENGKFTFKMNAQDEYVLIEAIYTKNGSNIVKSEMTLVDLRSRVFLLTSSERLDSADVSDCHLSRKDLDKFVCIIDDCFNLSKILAQLHVSGHFQYKSFDLKLGSAMLREETAKLTPKLKTWQSDLTEARKTYYLMNYIHGTSLQAFHTYFHSDYENGDAVQTMLLFIHPQMQATVVRDLYYERRKGYAEVCDRNILLCMGDAIHSIFTRLCIHKRSLTLENDGKSLRLTDKVHEGKILVAHLEEGSLYTVKTVLALYANTTDCLPEPNQILFCNQETSLEELDLLVQRCLGAAKFHEKKVLFCLANVEMLSNEIQFSLIGNLRSIRTKNVDSKFLLAIVCRGSKSNPFIDEFSDVVVTINPASDSVVKSIFKTECPGVFTLTSDFAGLGKTQKVRKLAHKKKRRLFVFHISGSLRRLILVQRLAQLRLTNESVLHIDIGNIDDPAALDIFLFELIILRYVSAGRMSVSLSTSDVVIEIANTMQNKLRDSLHTTMLFRNDNLTWKTNVSDFAVSMELNSQEQTVCRYLQCLEDKTLDQIDVLVSQGHTKPISASICRKLLQKYFGRIDEITFPILKIAINVLSDQLKKLSYSPFFRISRLQDMVGRKEELQTKSTLVKEMVNMSTDFASRSVKSYRKIQCNTIQNDEMSDDVSDCPSQTTGMIRWEDTNHLLFVFHSQNIQSISALYRDIKQVPEHIKQLFESQMKSKMEDLSSLQQPVLQNLLQKIVRPDPLPLPNKVLQNLAKEYALTTDNLLKMVLILLRIKANIPVIIMGETGCGKTSLVRYLAALCEVDFEVLSIHSGISEKVITDTIEFNNKEAIEGIQRDRWLFLDEINTSESIGLISEIICHHTCFGKTLAPNLMIIGACNPYKLRTESQLVTAGLTEKSKTDNFSKLVYRVLPLPERMVDYVWDFGSIGGKDERKYVSRMISGLFEDMYHCELLTRLLTASQTFVRQHESSVYAVSLRDIQRVKLLTSWFLKMLEMKERKQQSKFAIDCKTRAIILALAHCYHCRFQQKSVRKEYRNRVKQIIAINEDAIFKRKDDVIFEIIKEEQLDIMQRMDLPEGTACNSALIENVFVIVVSIFTRIPIFVVGKPGCSKSLAMQVIRSNLRGKDSKDKFFQNLPQLYCVSFQGSESSTSDGIKKVFEKAEKYQERNKTDNVLSVVILDEIGLAEVSLFNPLKVLHDLLEPNEDNVEHNRSNLSNAEKALSVNKLRNIIARPNIAVVGLSNWALDASKMNRAIYLSRTDMDEEELCETAKSISCAFLKTEFTQPVESKFEQDLQKFNVPLCIYSSDIQNELKSIAEAYNMYTQQLCFKNFHGLRDFYALVKYVARKFSLPAAVTQTDRHHIYKSDVADEKRIACIVLAGLERNFGGLQAEKQTLRDCFGQYFEFPTSVEKSVISLIQENVQDPLARHLMLITTGNSAIGILEQKLNEINRNRKEIIFGSHFEEDLTDDYNYRILNRIILCMEQGMVLILKDLESVYGSLYDMLNQNYTVIGNKQNCRIALGAYSNPICQVAQSFRCIVLIDENKIKACDPPFLNRFEKQYLRFSDVLNDDQEQLIQDVEYWIEGLVKIKTRTFRKTDIFPNYSYDLLASLLLKLYSHKSGVNEDILAMCKQELLWIIKPEAVVRLAEATREDIKAESELLKQQYLSLPLHNGLQELVEYEMTDLKKDILTLVFTNSNIHSKIQLGSHEKYQIEKLGTFKSEKQLSQRMEHFWVESKASILIVQCSAVEDENHILLTKTLIEKSRNIYKTKHSAQSKHVYLIIHLDKSKGTSMTLPQINYTVSDWKLVMMDTLDNPKIKLQEYLNMDILEAVGRSGPLEKCIPEQLFWAVTRIKYGPFGRSVPDIEEMLEEMKESTDFLTILGTTIWNIICEMDIYGKEWYLDVACDIQKLNISSSFVDALDQYILGLIRKPLSKIIYFIERTGILDSYFVTENSANRRASWNRCIRNSNTFSLKDIPDHSGPECYVCETANLRLRMPFSIFVYTKLELKRDEYLNDILLLKVKYEVEKGQKFYDTLCEELSTQMVEVLQSDAPEISNLFYPGWERDYINDFCSILSLSLNPTITLGERKHFMEWVISQKTKFQTVTGFNLLVTLHTSSWLNSALFRAEMQLLGICGNVLINKDLMTELRNIQKAYTEIDNNGTSKVREGDEEESDSNMEDVVHYTRTDSVVLSRGESCEFDKSFSRDRVALKVDTSSDIEIMTPNDFLVDCICKSMLPTTAKLAMYKGMEIWQQKTNYLLATASKVSVGTDSMYSLRVCCEVVSDMLMPFAMPKSHVENLASILLKGNEVHSKQVFAAILNIIQICINKHDNDTEVALKCYSVFSSYLTRCISSKPESRAAVLGLLYIEIGKHGIPDTAIQLLKTPILLALKLELEELGSFNSLLYIKEDITGQGIDNNQTHESKFDSSEDNWNGSDILMNLDLFLKTFHWKINDCPFCLLLVDILQDIFADDITIELENSNFEIPEAFNSCCKVIKDCKFGIQFIAAISYVKALFASKPSKRKEVLSESNTSLIELNLCSNVEEGHVSNLLQMLYLKTLAKHSLVCRIQNKFDDNDFLDKINWGKNYKLHGFERSPMCLCIDENKHSHFGLCCRATEINPKLIKELVNSSKKDYQCLLIVLSFAAKTVHLAQSCDNVLLSSKTLTGLLLAEIEEQQCVYKYYFQILVGERDFKTPFLQIGQHTQTDDYHLITFLLSIYTMLIAHTSVSETGSISFLSKCLKCPQTLTCRTLPGFSVNASDHSDKFETYLTKSSKCGHRFVLYSKQVPALCPFCAKKFETNHTVHDIQYDRRLVKSLQNLKRREHSFMSDYLKLLVKGCLFGALSLDNASIENINETLISKEYSQEILWTDIKTHWTKLSISLNVHSSKLSLILHNILQLMENDLCNDTTDLKTMSEVSQWEDKLQRLMLPAIQNRFERVKQMIQKHDAMHGIDNKTKEQQLFEVDKLPGPFDTGTLPLLFRMKAIPTKDNFCFEFNGKENEFPFIDLVLNFEECLKNTLYIYDIVRWNIAAVANANYVLMKNECLEMKVIDFIYLKSDPMNKDALKARFERFQKAWDILITRLEHVENIPKLNRILMSTKMADCMIYDKDTVLFEILHMLVSIQNEFLDLTLQLAKETNALKFLVWNEQCSLQCVEISEVQTDDLIDSTVLNWEGLLDKWSQCELEYGSGEKITYEFHSIEKALVAKLISGKSFINFQNALQKTIFKDSLYVNYASLLSDLKQSVPQEQVTAEIRDGLNNKTKENSKNATTLLTHLGIVMTLLKKTSGKPRTSLVEYIRKWRNILPRDFPCDLLPYPQNCVQLCHVVAVSEILEEICSESVIDGLDDDYRESLDCVSQKEFSQIASNISISCVMLKAMKRFTYRCLATRSASSLTALRQYLSDESFWPDGCLKKNIVHAGGKEETIEILLPENIMVKHIHDVIKLLEKAIKSHEEKAKRMDDLYVTFQQTPSVKKMAKKKYMKKQIVAAFSEI